ncbi:MAG: DUF1517 domain-containing protein [Sandaracinaceae bacterium]
MRISTASSFGWLLAFLFGAWLIAASALAQDTGSSFGGGSFGGGGGGYGGGSSSGGWSGSSSSSSYDYGTSSGREAGPFDIFLLCVLPGILLALMAWGLARQDRARRMGGAQGWNHVDVSAIRLGIDWRARSEVQATLEQLARTGSTSGNANLTFLVRETIAALLRAETAWLYASASNHHPMGSAAAEGIFRQLATDARSKFRTELLRNADGVTTSSNAGHAVAHPTEGEGTVVVTLVLASRREIPNFDDLASADAIKGLLHQLSFSADPRAIVAMEVIWSPAAENDRMSTAELEQFYPDLEKIDERSIAGRVFCMHCKGPFAMELLTCPHCGAPAPATWTHAT